MSSPEDQEGRKPEEQDAPVSGEQPETDKAPEVSDYADPYSYDDSYSADSNQTAEPAPAEAVPAPVESAPAAVPAALPSGGGQFPPSETESTTEDDDEEEGMLRMSFMEHLEELRMRIIRALMGIGVAFALSLFYANDLWRAISAPAVAALKSIGADPNLAQITPTDAFTTIWVKVPMLTAIFLASPWVLYQVWAFIAPGLYKKERRWAAPFVLCTAGLFILGGLFAYFVAFRFGLTFLLGIGRDINVKPVVSLVEYFDLFVNVMLGVGLVFELPVLIFFLSLLRIVTPRFLLANSRYAILVIVIIAAVVTPTPDVFNLMLFTVPMVLLYFVGVFASYLLFLHREEKKFPWFPVLLTLAAILLIAGGGVYLAIARYGFHLVPKWPFLVK